ncbi:MAG: hypothetical protein IVW57_00215 [Ktedonobacterales bacterium]|nr:hypothetical protein [Ktedonobacterales bacterium]
MPVLLPNVLLTVQRGQSNAAAHATGPATAHLSGVYAHLAPVKASAYLVLPDAALKSQYQAVVESGADIVTGDTITAITLMDGATPWPGDYPASGDGSDPTSVWTVTYHMEAAPGLLASRTLYLARFTGQGPLGVQQYLG